MSQQTRVNFLQPFKGDKEKKDFRAEALFLFLHAMLNIMELYFESFRLLAPNISFQ